MEQKKKHLGNFNISENQVANREESDLQWLRDADMRIFHSQYPNKK